MAFDLAKIDWSEEELKAAAGLDKIYEGLADGIDMGDILLFTEVMPLWAFLESATKAEYASKLVALGTILFRDNF